MWHTYTHKHAYIHTNSGKNGDDAPEDPEAANVEPEKVTNLLGLRDALYSKVRFIHTDVCYMHTYTYV